MAGPGLFFDPGTGTFGFNPGGTPPTGGGGTGQTAWFAGHTGTPGDECQPKVTLADTPLGTTVGNFTLDAGPFATSQEALNWIAVNHPECGITPIGPGGGGGSEGPCYQNPEGFIIHLAPGEQPDPSWTPVPCPPPGNQPGSSCDNPLWIKNCPPEKPKPGVGGTGGTGGTGTSGTDNTLPALQGTGCEAIDQFAQQYADKDPLAIFQEAGLLGSNNNIPGASDFLDFVRSIPLIGDALASIFELQLKIPIAMVTGFVWMFSLIAKMTSCPQGALSVLSIRTAALTWIRRIFGVRIDKQLEQIGNAESYICPSSVPGIAEANLALRTGDIDQATWRCWVRLNNVDESLEAKVYNALRVQLTPEQIIMLWRRKGIQDDEVSGLLSQAGMISTDDQMRLDQVTQFIPPVTDLLHFIVRGVGDPDIVQRFGLLDEFDQLYQGKLKDWGAANGISDEVMETYHAGHWIVPPTGQLFTMLQRLRPDNIQPGIDESDWTVTFDDIDRALRENAIAPFWRERLKAISYNPIPMRQAVHAYTTGSATEEQVFDALQDNGYSPLTARQFIEWLAIQRRDHVRTNKVVGLYIGMGVNREDASQRLQEEGYTEEEASDALDWANLQADDKSKEKCISATLKNYELGKMDETGLQSELARIGLDPEQITRLADQAECSKKATGKEIPAGQLCSMVDHGLITPADYHDRLVRLGYDDSDADRIVAECNIKLTERQLAVRERALRQAAREASAAASKADSAARRHAADLRRQANDLARYQREQASAEAKGKRTLQQEVDKASRQALAATRMRLSAGSKARSIEQRLGRAAQLWAEFSGKTLDVAASDIRSGIGQAVTQASVSEDQAVRAAVLAALGASKRKTVDLVSEIVDIARVLHDYAEIANASVSESTISPLPTAQSSVGTGVQASTNGHGGSPLST